MTIELVVVLLLVLGAEFVNGWTDAPNAIATVIGTRSLSPRQALAMGALFNLLGVLTGTAVATTIGTGIIDPRAVNLTTVGGAMVGLIVWSSVGARWGIPTSESHALVAGLAGAGLASAGPSVLLWAGWKKVLIGLLFSSVLGFVAGFAMMVGVDRAFRRAAPGKVKGLFRSLQVMSSAFMAFSHGSNDGQKFIGAFTLALVLAGVLPEFAIPIWVILLCAAVMGLGTQHRRMAHHQDPGHGPHEAPDAPGLRRRSGRCRDNHRSLVAWDPVEHHAHDLYGHHGGRCHQGGTCRVVAGHLASCVGLDRYLPHLRGPQLVRGPRHHLVRWRTLTRRRETARPTAVRGSTISIVGDWTSEVPRGSRPRGALSYMARPTAVSAATAVEAQTQKPRVDVPTAWRSPSVMTMSARRARRRFRVAGNTAPLP